jgi:hypothetical protein
MARNLERSPTAPNLFGGRAEQPRVDIGFLVEVAADRAGHPPAVLVGDPAAPWRHRARVLDGELQESIRPEHAVDLGHDDVEFGHVHQAHEGNDEIERVVAEREANGASAQIPDPELLASLLRHGRLQEAPRDVDRRHACAAAGEQAGVVSLAAA